MRNPIRGQSFLGNTQINKLMMNPHHNLLIAGTEDFKLRFIDLNSNKVVKTVVGHADAVSALA